MEIAEPADTVEGVPDDQQCPALTDDFEGPRDRAALCRVFAGKWHGTASTQERRNFVLELGVDAAVGYDEPNWPATVLELTDGRGVDVLIESIGSDVFEPELPGLGHLWQVSAARFDAGPRRAVRAATDPDESQATIGCWRVLVYSDPDGNAVFSMDRPSTAFTSLGIAEITEVGLGLDGKVANLLRVIGVDPGEAFGT